MVVDGISNKLGALSDVVDATRTLPLPLLLLCIIVCTVRSIGHSNKVYAIPLTTNELAVIVRGLPALHTSIGPCGTQPVSLLACAA